MTELYVFNLFLSYLAFALSYGALMVALEIDARRQQWNQGGRECTR